MIDLTTQEANRALEPASGRWASAAFLPGSRRVRCLALAYGRAAGGATEAATVLQTSGSKPFRASNA